MAYNKQKIKSKAKNFQSGNSMAMAADSLAQDKGEEEVREAVASIVTTLLEERSAIIQWLIGEEWAAKLVARIVDAIGETILDWLT